MIKLSLMIIFILSAVPAWGGSSSLRDQILEVVRVTDGDTLTVMDPTGQKTKVRLYGIDTPEMDQPFGPEAKAALSQLVLGQIVKVYTWDTDRWGRTVGIVVKDDYDVAWTLTAQGLAWVSARYCRDPVICPAYLTRMETAQKTHQGLWANDTATPPENWRKK